MREGNTPEEFDDHDIEKLHREIRGMLIQVDREYAEGVHEGLVYEAKLIEGQKLILESLRMQGIDTLPIAPEHGAVSGEFMEPDEAFYGDEEYAQGIDDIAYTAYIVRDITMQYAWPVEHRSKPVKQRLQLTLEYDTRLEPTLRAALIQAVDSLFPGDSIDLLGPEERSLMYAQMEKEREEQKREERILKLREFVTDVLEVELEDIVHDDKNEMLLRLSWVVIDVYFSAKRNNLRRHLEEATSYLKDNGVDIKSAAVVEAMRRAYVLLEESQK